MNNIHFAPLPKGVNRALGRAMHRYEMLAEGDRVLVGVSGGIDSLVLIQTLLYWRTKAPISYELTCVHIDMGHQAGEPGKAAKQVEQHLLELGLKPQILASRWQVPPDTDPAEGNKNICFTCAKNRRRQLFDFAQQHGYNKLALGHHQGDILETFFLNMCYAGNISTMVPRQDLFGGKLAIIRPMAHLTKTEIRAIAEANKLIPIYAPCPVCGLTKRKEMRSLIDEIEKRIPGASKQMFSALANVRSDYLLKPPSSRS